MAWKSQYPAFPDLTGDALGDVRARLERQARGFSENPTEQELADYDADASLYWASILKLFVDTIDSGGEVEPWINQELRRAFHSVLAGRVWEDAICLPGRVFREEWYAYSPKERRDMELCRRVLDELRYSELFENQKLKVTNVIAQVASEKNLSYETVRAAYYEWKGWHQELRDRSHSKKAHEDSE